MEIKFGYLGCIKGTSGGVTVSKLDKQTYTSEFETYWVPHSFGLVPHQSKELCKLLLEMYQVKRSEALT